MTPLPNPARIEHDGNQGYGTAEPRLGLRDLIKVLRRRRTIIFGTVAVTTLATALIAYQMTPRYTAGSAVSIEPRETRILNTEAVLEQIPQDRTMIETEIKLLGSRSFAHYAIEALGLLDDPNFNPVLRAQLQEVDALTADAPEEGSFGALVAEYTQMLSDWVPETWLVASGLAQQASEPVAEDPYEAQNALEGAIDSLLGGLRIEQSGNSYVLSIQYTSTDPEEAARVANDVARLYVENRLDIKRSANTRAGEWLSARADQLRAALLESESAIAAYRADNQLIDSGGVTLDDEQLAALNKELIVARADRTQRTAKLNLVRKLRGQGKGLDSIIEVISSPIINSLREQEAQLLRQEAQLAQEYGVNHPTLLEIRAEKQNLADKINSEIQNIIRVLENELSIAHSREAALEQNLELAKAQKVQNRAAEVDLRELERG